MTDETTKEGATVRRPRASMRRIMLIYVKLSAILGVIVYFFSQDRTIEELDVIRTVYADPQLRLVYAAYWFFGLALIYFLANVKRLWKPTLLLGSISAALLFVILEIIGPLLLPAEGVPTLRECGLASTRLHHVLLPNTKMVWDHHQYANIVIHTNEDGLRSAYSRKVFHKQDVRIAVLGDSYAFGFLVNEIDSLPGQLERDLRTTLPSDQNVGVLNAGILSYAPLIERQQFEDVVQHYHPQVTIAVMHLNEIGNDYQYAQENTGTWDELHFPYPDSWTKIETPPWEQSVSRQVLRATRILHPLQTVGDALGLATADETQIDRYDYQKFEVTIDGNIETSHFFVMRYSPEQLKQYYDATWRQFVALNEQCEKLGSKFVLVLLPFGFHYDPQEAPNDIGRINREYTGDEPFRFAFFEEMTRRGHRDGITVLSLLPTFNATDERPLCFENDLHYNAAGNKVAAQAIASYLLEHQMIPPKPDTQ